MNRRKKIISIISLTCAIMVFSMLIPASNGLGEVYATSTSGNTIDRSSPNVITDDDRADADAQLKAHMDSILKRTNPDEYTLLIMVEGTDVQFQDQNGKPCVIINKPDGSFSQ